MVRFFVKSRFWFLCSFFFFVYLLILSYNWKTYPMRYGYDAADHIQYAKYIRSHWKRPGRKVTKQFYNPPTYYVLTALLSKFFNERVEKAGRQIAYAVSLVVFSLLVWIAWILWRDNPVAVFWFLGFYTFCPTTYKIFCMLRTEVLLVPLFVISTLAVVYFSRNDWSISWIKTVFLWGVINGASVSVRHFGFFIVIFSIILSFLLFLNMKWSFRKWIAFSTIQFFIGAGSYFFVQHILGGSGTAFNLTPKPFHLSLITCLRLKTLFTHPIRPGLNYCLFPPLYADFWGDYWRYWVEYLGRFRIPSSPHSVILLKNMMWAAIFPTILLAGGWIKALKGEVILSRSNPCKKQNAIKWDFLLSIFLFLSFLLYIIMATLYAIPHKGDTFKGIYIVYLIPVMAVFAGSFAGWLGQKKKWITIFLYSMGVVFFSFSLPICLCLQGVV